ncbi:MAG: outer membrane protein transport protein [Chromatiaceae bacterium]|jgi:long-chain fatty acid transport protein
MVLAGLLLSSSAQAGRPAFTGLFATADSAETVFANPAGMSLLEGEQKTGGVILLNSWSKFDVDESNTTNDGGSPRDPQGAIIPSAYYTRPVGEKLTAGVSFNIPTGFGSFNGPNWAGRYYSDSFSLVYVSLAPALSYQLTESLSIGLGGQVMYSSSEIKTRINNEVFEPGAADGRLRAEADGFGYSWSLSALYEFSEDTRVGFSYRAETDVDMEADLDFRNALRPPGLIEDLEGETVDISDTVPMIIGGGLFHRFDNDWELTLDTVWVEFSQFGVTEIHLDGEDINIPDGNYNDFFIYNAGLTWPWRTGMRAGVGLLYMEQAVDDDDRSFGIALDRVWGIGAGVEIDRGEGRMLDINLNLFDTGEAPIDTGDSPVRGRVSGEFENHYSLALEFTYHWK